jgi:hypothetical protein
LEQVSPSAIADVAMNIIPAHATKRPKNKPPTRFLETLIWTPSLSFRRPAPCPASMIGGFV